MGYQLVFWKQEGVDEMGDAQTVYQRLMEGSDLRGLAAVPVDEILSMLSPHVPLTDVHASGAFSVSDEGQEVIEFGWSGVHFSAEFRPFGPTNHRSANRIIDVMAALGYPLFDPQTGERFAPRPEY